MLRRLIDVRLDMLLIVAALLVGGCSDAEPDNTLPGEMPSVEAMVEAFGISTAALDDLEFIANEEGWTLQEAVYRIGWQEGFSFFLSEVRAEYPDEFAGGGILGDAGPRDVFISFRSAVPAEVRSDPRLEHLEVDFREGSGFSEAELADQVIDVHYTLRDLGFIEIGTGPDIDTGRVRVDAARRPIDRGKTDEEIIATLPPNVRAANVVIVFHPEGTVLGGDD